MNSLINVHKPKITMQPATNSRKECSQHPESPLLLPSPGSFCLNVNMRGVPVISGTAKNLRSQHWEVLLSPSRTASMEQAGCSSQPVSPASHVQTEVLSRAWALPRAEKDSPVTHAGCLLLSTHPSTESIVYFYTVHTSLNFKSV